MRQTSAGLTYQNKILTVKSQPELQKMHAEIVLEDEITVSENISSYKHVPLEKATTTDLSEAGKRRWAHNAWICSPLGLNA